MTTHFIGIGGIGMSALAHLLLDRGEEVSGSDLGNSEVTQALQHRGASVHYGHHVDHLPTTTRCVVVSSMVSSSNPEWQEAMQRGVPVLHRSELLAELMAGYEPLLVAGTHGKTTTSALLTWVLNSLGWDPSYAVGGLWQSGLVQIAPKHAPKALHRMAAHGHSGRGLYFVAEADESDGTFLRYPSRGAIITNCESDHLDFFGSMAALVQAFQRFASKIPRQHLIWCADDPLLRSLHLLGPSYGRHLQADYAVVESFPTSWGMHFRLRGPKQDFAEFAVPLLGEHNVLNAASVVALLHTLGLQWSEIAEGMATFPGMKRRCEPTSGQPLILSDYAHHPTEVRATLAAIRAAIGSRRLVVAFQPHRYSRTQLLMEEFADSFHDADELILTDIYGACEAPIPGVSSEVLALHMQAHDQHLRLEPRTHLVQALETLLGPEDVLVCMGAGDIDAVAHQLALRIPTGL